MQNYSGGFNSTLHTEAATVISTTDIGTESINTTTTMPMTLMSFISSSLPNKNKDEGEIQYIMKSMEALRMKNPDQFATVLINNKKLYDMISQNNIKTKEDMALFENLFQEVEDIDIDYLFWSAHKCIKKVSIDSKNMKLIHFFIIKKGYKLTNKQIYHNFLNEFMTSLKHLNFIGENDNDVYLYVAMFQMFINQGDADVNDSMNEMKNTPLHYAVIYNQFQFLMILIQHKDINVNALNVNGDTPMDMALKNIMISDNKELNEEVCIILCKNKGVANTMKNYFHEVFSVSDDNNKDEDEGEVQGHDKEKEKIKK